mgnify:CR=1 FL=1
MNVLIKGGTVVNAELSIQADILCTDGLIAQVGTDIDAPSGAADLVLGSAPSDPVSEKQ